MNEQSNNQTGTFLGSHIARSSYIAGYLLSLVLTVVPFLMVLDRGLPKQVLVVGIIMCALVQLLVQAVCFLHLDLKAETRWNLMTFLFTLMTVVILVVGSLWIMTHLDYNMMHVMPEP